MPGPSTMKSSAGALGRGPYVSICASVCLAPPCLAARFCAACVGSSWARFGFLTPPRAFMDGRMAGNAPLAA